MKRHFFVRRNLARLLLRLARWKTVGEVPRKGILVGVWDESEVPAELWSRYRGEDG